MEFALIMPVLFLVLFGIVEFGIAYNDYQSLRQGVREGARQAVVKDYGSTTDCGLNGPAATQIDDVKKILCQTKERAGLGNEVRVALRVTAVAPAGYKNNSVKVCAVRSLTSITGFMSPFIDGRHLQAETQMRAERTMGAVIDLGDTSNWHEIDPTGQDWSWC